MPASNIFQRYSEGLAFKDKREQDKLQRQQKLMALDDQRKGALFNDARIVNSLLKSGNKEKALGVLSQRKDILKQIGGDPSDTQEITDYVVKGDLKGAVDLLDSVEQAGVMSGYLQDITPKNQKPKLGTYKPSDYTIDSWAEFAKNGDPSALERYQSGAKARQAEIKDKVLELKEEKFKLDKQKAEMEENIKALASANKKKDSDRARYLETKDSQNAIGNINTLLDEDLDLIYGGFEWAQPDILRSQKGKNMLARKNQVVSSLKLLAAGKLKGQGSITENERTMLAQAATTLENQDIDPKLAEEELKRILPIYNYFINGDSPVNENTGDKNILSEEDLIKKYGG